MLRVAFRNLAEHKLRTALLGLAVVAGVGFVTAAYVFTDSLSAAFDRAFAAGAEGVDIVVQSTAEPESTPGGEAFPRVDAGLVERVAAIDGVATASPFLQSIVTLVIEGEERTPFGAPDFGISWSGSGYFVVQDGRAPAEPGEVVVDSAGAENRGIVIGDTVDIAGASRAESFEVVGTFGFGEGGSGFGATFLGFTHQRAAELFGIPNEVNSIEVVVDEGADVEQVLAAIAGALPDDAEALDSREAAEAQAAQLQEGIGFFNTFLLVFGAIALVVGAFVVYNAFRVVVAQRGRELALMRVLGTTRRQLMWSVLVEALVVGFIASLVGLAAGIGLAVGSRAVLAATGTELPDAGLVLSGRTFVIALVVGVVTTLLSALLPALRTTRISPMEALRDQPEMRRIKRGGASIGVILLLGAVALVGIGVTRAYDEAAITGNADPLVWIGLGSVVAFASFFLLARALVRPLLGVIGRGARSVPALLGRENARRTPRRTAVTATALMIGLGLVATVAVLSRSVEDTILVALEEAFTAEVIVQAGGFDALSGIPLEVADEVAVVEGVAEVARLNMVPVELPDGGGSSLALGVEPETVELAIAFDQVDGSFADLGSGTVAIQRVEADSRGIALGDIVDLTIDDMPHPVEVVAIFDFSGGVADSTSYYLAYDTVRDLQEAPRDISLAIGLDEGSDIEATSERISDALVDFPAAAVSTIADIVGQVRSALAAVVGMVAGLLLMSVAVAVVGIVLTLYLAVYERTRETGLLRAVGMTRRQVRRMIRFESVLIAVFGTLLGLVLGLFCGWALSVGVVGEGIRFGVPWVWVIAGFLGALAAGVVAAVIPARRASRMDVLAAIAYE